ncbi:hypothetical protein [Blastochloris tepida]|uniref:Uncharacterized protein n=1 Tax=Blastochloris tepida TaxID=2233851 RepID=A0A348G585_9HYPH|nr:hypothetical protein [Blastochloris tepida]BBF94718.1 hypothetical protein BLTE_34030 [Blastochloris tepida]
MNAVWRVVVIAFGLIVAAGAGLVFLVSALASADFGEAGPEIIAQFALFAWLFTFFSAEQGLDPASMLGLLIASLIIVPVAMPGALVAILAEAFGWRSLTLYMTANAALGALAAAAAGLYDVMNLDQTAPAATPVESRAVLVMAATGGVVGLVYWLVAGRKASGFLNRPALNSPPPGP